MTTNSPIAPTNRQATKPFRRIEFATPSTSTANFTMIQAFEQLYLPQRPNIATATVECNRRQLQTCKSVMGDIPVGQITRDTLIQYRDKRLCEKSGSVSTLSINNDLKLLRRVLHAAGYFPDGHNVAIPLGLPVHAITLEDLTRLWNLVDQTVWPGSMAHEYRGLKIDLYPGAWWRALLMLAYSTGIRRGDLFLLRWEQLDWQSILLEFDGDARPKRIPITGPLRPWLHILRQNNSPTVLGHLDGNEFDKEIGRLRTLSGISHFGLHTLRCLAVHQWEQASPGCGALIRNHKEGATVSEANFRRLATAADLLTYPPEILAASIPADKSKPFLDPQRDPFEPVPISEDKKRQAEAAQPDSSLATFKNFFSPGESSAPTRLESMTLRDVFETSLRPILETDGRTDSTMSGYRLALTHWERLTSNPLINEITTAYLQQFRKSAKDELHRSPASCNSWFRSLRSILNHLGPRSNFNARSRAALAFYQEIPWLDNLKQETPNPVHLDDEQISRLYINSQITEWPRKSRTGCEPCDWWRCAIVIMVNYGQRRSDWYNMRTNAVSFEKETVIFKAKKTGKRQILVLNPTVTWHLRKLNPEGREFIFSPSQTNKQLYREWHRIQSAAKVSDPEGMPFTFHSLRATAAMRYHEYFPGTAELLLGHALRRESQVTAKHYLGSAQLKPLWNAIRNIPQPSAFLEAMEADTVKQTE